MKRTISLVIACQAGAVAYAVADVALAAVSVPVGVLSIARGIVVALGLALPVGGAIGFAVSYLGREQPRRPRAAAVVALPIAAAIGGGLWSGFLIWGVKTFHNTSLTALAAVMVAAVAISVAAVAFLILVRAFGFVDRLAPNAGPWAVATGLAVAAIGLGLWVKPAGLACAAALVAHIVRWRVTWQPRPRVLAIATGVAFVAALSPLGDDSPMHDALAQRGSFVPAIESALTPVLDFDGDGFLSVLGGGDCAGFDSDRSPRGVEVADNGVDEDCRFGDLAALPPLPTAPAGPGVDRVILVTVAGLDLDSAGAFTQPMPKLTQRLAGAVRFRESVGLEGPVRLVAPVLIAGRLPPALHPRSSGFPTGGPSLPWLVERAGGHAFAFVPKSLPLDSMSTQFQRSRSDARKSKAKDIVGLATARLRKQRMFTWIHLTIAWPKQAEAVDAALDDLLSRLGRDHVPYRVLLVGLETEVDVERPAPRGGPLAVFGSDLAPREVREGAGMFDVYPTLLGFAGVAEDASEYPDVDPVAGVDLMSAGARPAVLGGWIGSHTLLGAFGSAGTAIYDTVRDDFEIEGDRAALLEPLRDRFLAPRLAARNRALDAALIDDLPDDIDGSPVRYAASLTIYGCTHREMPGHQLAVTIYMRGGENLQPDDLITFKLSSPHVGSMRGRVVPVDGAYPFGTWKRGRLVAHTALVDLRPVNPGTATLWVGVLRDGVRLAVTDGLGSTPDWGRVCAIDL